jgi:hypothetical protein
MKYKGASGGKNMTDEYNKENNMTALTDSRDL